jgi:predicted metal-binding protein
VEAPKDQLRVSETSLQSLIDLAISQGASGARLIRADRIVVEERLARMCRDPGCSNYGLSGGCPPQVSGPEGFRELLSRGGFESALVLTLDVPTEVLLGEERREVFQLLHTMVSAVEQKARSLGYSRARAFAGGACKELFCQTEPDCNVIARGGPCRHPNLARHSMSGYGVDVTKLMVAAGWAMTRATAEPDPAEDNPTSPVVGLVLVG